MSLRDRLLALFREPGFTPANEYELAGRLGLNKKQRASLAHEVRLLLRDGPLPEIVLQPDVSPTQDLFRDLWEKLRVGLSEIADIGEFSPGDFSLALFPPPHWQERPPLAYADVG